MSLKIKKKFKKIDIITTRYCQTLKTGIFPDTVKVAKVRPLTMRNK